MDDRHQRTAVRGVSGHMEDGITSRRPYHEESPYRVVEEDTACYHEHTESH
jgi:hypothetical protein